jgi:hypothetical protein
LAATQPGNLCWKEQIRASEFQTLTQLLAAKRFTSTTSEMWRIAPFAGMVYESIADYTNFSMPNRYAFSAILGWGPGGIRLKSVEYTGDEDIADTDSPSVCKTKLQLRLTRVEGEINKPPTNTELVDAVANASKQIVAWKPPDDKIHEEWVKLTTMHTLCTDFRTQINNIFELLEHKNEIEFTVTLNGFF